MLPSRFNNITHEALLLGEKMHVFPYYEEFGLDGIAKMCFMAVDMKSLTAVVIIPRYLILASLYSTSFV